MSERVKKKRALEKAGLIHAAGWIRSKDRRAFDKLVKAAEQDVMTATPDSNKQTKKENQ